MGRHRSPDQRIAALAARQAGIVQRAQLRAAGLSDDAVDRRVAAGRLHRLHRGVYAVGHPRLAPLGRETAALLAIGPGAVVSHMTAGVLWGLPLTDVHEVHLTIAGANARRRRRPGLTLHVVRVLPAQDCARHHGLPVASPERTLLDLAGLLPPSVVARAAEEAQVRRLVHRGSVAALLERHPRAAGVACLRRLIDDEPRVTRSEAERRLLALLGRAGLPLPSTNVRIHGHEVDALWAERGLVAEVDGFAFHRSRAAFERDRRRDAALVARGYRVVRLTWRRMTDEPERVAIELAELLRPPA